jgi:hypothetical protein
MQKVVQVRGLYVGLAADYRHSRKGRAIQDNPHYCPNSKELMDNAINKFENVGHRFLDVVAKCFKEPLVVLKALEPLTIGPADQKKLAGGQSSNTSLATFITPMGSHAAVGQPLVESPSTATATGKSSDDVVQEMHGSNAPDGGN